MINKKYNCFITDRGYFQTATFETLPTHNTPPPPDVRQTHTQALHAALQSKAKIFSKGVVVECKVILFHNSDEASFSWGFKVLTDFLY